MGRGWVHTVHKGGQWVNEIENGESFSTHATRDEAVAAGRERAQADRTEHVIHNQDGTIGERNSYGSDPRESAG